MRESQSLGDIRFATLARAGEGLTQWRPLVLGFGTLLVAAAIVALAQWMAFGMHSGMGALLGFLLCLVAVVVVLAGTSGVGAMLMDKAQNQPMRGFSEAAIFGLLCLPKFLGFALIVMAASLAFMVVAAVVYFLCKIPVLGAILAFVAHPILVITGAAFLVALMVVIYPLYAPAVWSGLSMKAALANVVGIARKRLVQVVLMQMVLYFIVGIISWLLIAGLFPAGMALTSMAAAIIGIEGNPMMMGGYGLAYMMQGLMNSGSMLGLLSGLGALVAVVIALMAQVMLMGLNLVYLEAQESVDTSESEGALNGFLDGVRKTAGEAKQRAMEAAERAKQVAAQKAQEVAAANEARKAAAAEQALQQAQAKAEQEAQRLAAAQAAQAAAQLQAEEDAARRQVLDAEAAQAHAAQETARLKAEAEAAQVQAQENAARLQAEAHAETARLQAQAEAAEQARRHAAVQVVAPAAAAATQCPSCHDPVTPDDAFCGNCGHKLK